MLFPAGGRGFALVAAGRQTGVSRTAGGWKKFHTPKESFFCIPERGERYRAENFRNGREGNGFGLPKGRLFAITGRKIFGMIRKGERFRFTERETFCNHRAGNFRNDWKGGTVSVCRKGDFLQLSDGKISEWLEREKDSGNGGERKMFRIEAQMVILHRSAGRIKRKRQAGAPPSPPAGEGGSFCGERQKQKGLFRLTGSAAGILSGSLILAKIPCICPGNIV